MQHFAIFNDRFLSIPDHQAAFDADGQSGGQNFGSLMTLRLPGCKPGSLPLYTAVVFTDELTISAKNLKQGK